MKRDDLESQAERYKREIMDLYSRNAPVQDEPDTPDQSDTERKKPMRPKLRKNT